MKKMISKLSVLFMAGILTFSLKAQVQASDANAFAPVLTAPTMLKITPM